MRATFIDEAILAWSNPGGLIRILQAESRGMANSMSPLDHPWNFDSAMVAKHRLRAITRADRKACGDGKWVKVKARAICAVPWQTRMSTSPIVQELVRHWDRQDRAICRWEWRR